MLYDAKWMEDQAIMNTAAAICAAARTAPKACGIDQLLTLVVTGEEKGQLAAEMRRIANLYNNGSFLIRDADNVDKSTAVVLVGTKESHRGLGEICGLCHFKNCNDCKEANACCIYDAMDLGIALGSAAASCADRRIDSRIMFSIGKAAASLGLMGENITMIMGLPLSISGKSPFFDRKTIK